MFRVKEEPPFTYTGVDFAGSLHSTSTNKAWICLFTYLVTRAVHLDITKRCLRKMADYHLTNSTLQLLKLNQLSVQGHHNYVSSSDLEEPLTPSHLLIGRRVLNLPDHLGHTFNPEDEEFTVVNSSQPNERMKRLSGALNHFWSRWRNEYLTEFIDCATDPAIAVGDIVVVHDEALPRGFWRLGKIEELIVGRDGGIRGAAVRVQTAAPLPSSVARWQ